MPTSAVRFRHRLRGMFTPGLESANDSRSGSCLGRICGEVACCNEQRKGLGYEFAEEVNIE